MEEFDVSIKEKPQIIEAKVTGLRLETRESLGFDGKGYVLVVEFSDEEGNGGREFFSLPEEWTPEKGVPVVSEKSKLGRFVRHYGYNPKVGRNVVASLTAEGFYKIVLR